MQIEFYIPSKALCSPKRYPWIKICLQEKDTIQSGRYTYELQFHFESHDEEHGKTSVTYCVATQRAKELSGTLESVIYAIDKLKNCSNFNTAVKACIMIPVFTLGFCTESQRSDYLMINIERKREGMIAAFFANDQHYAVDPDRLQRAFTSFKDHLDNAKYF